MINKLGLIVGISIAALILIAAGVMIGQYGLNQKPEATTQPVKPTLTTTIPTPATQTAKPTITTNIPTPSPTTNTPTPSQTLSGIPSNAKVDFTLQITSVTETGALSRLITGEIGNSGNVDAHNVVGKIEVYSNGKLIKVNNGQNSIIKALGTIGAGKIVTTTVDLTFGFFDGLTISQNGATVNLQISSDEETQLLSYDYKP